MWFRRVRDRVVVDRGVLVTLVNIKTAVTNAVLN